LSQNTDEHSSRKEAAVSEIVLSRCAVVVNEALPAGLAANAASVITMTLGRRVDGLIGPDVRDADGVLHAGIVLIPVAILTANAERIKVIRNEAQSDAEAVCVGFTALAQSCKTYGEYVERMGAAATADLEYVAIGLFGPKRLVNRLTGSLPLLR
jgi:hypothetical protein